METSINIDAINIDAIGNKNLEEEMHIIPKKYNPKKNIKTKLDDNISKQTEIEVSTVLTLCPLPESLNIDMIKEDITKYMIPREEYYKYKNRSPYVEDEFSEYFTARASGGYEIGSGHCGMDVKTKYDEGIDAMCVIMNKELSNEKSVIQNFASSGSDLDKLFKEKRDNEAVELFMNDYKNKLENVKETKKLKELYILSFISTEADIYIACFNINIENIAYVKSGGFVEGKKENYVNILINNFIDSNIGKVTLYKSKKRVELRLKKEVLKNEHVHNIYSMNSSH